MKRISLSFIVCVLVCTLVRSSAAQSTQFTYQGNLKNGASAANGNYDFEFALFDAVTGGTQIGATLIRTSVAVADGNFAVDLDFGPQFQGPSRFLEIRVRPTGQPGLTTLGPRQQIKSNPYSIKSLTADTATTANSATTAASATNAVNATNAATATNALQLGGVAAGQYVLTGDPRLSDARTPAPGSSNYIQNQNAVPQALSNFNVSGNGTLGGTLSANTVNSATSFNLGGNRFAGSGTGTGGFANSNTFVGFFAGNSNTPDPGNGQNGNFNSFFGNGAGQLNSIGFGNSFFGNLAGQLNTTGTFNSFFGFQAGNKTTGSRNAFFGNNAGFSNVASDNSFFGNRAGENNTSGNFNSFFGSLVGASNLTGFQNTYMGWAAGNSSTAGSSNTLVGYRAGVSISTNGNSFFGWNSGENTTTGGNNTFFGTQSGRDNATGSKNTAFGYSANFLNTNLTNATAIGADARVDANNSLVLGSVSGINGAAASTNVGIGTTSPAERLHVVGNGLFTGNLTVNGLLNGALPAGSSNYIQNTTTQQAASSFNISGNGVVGGSLSVGNVGTSGRLFLNRATAIPANSADISFGSSDGPDFSMGTSQGSAAPSDFSIYNYGTNSNAFTIQRSTGFLGVGNNNPTERFHVAGNGIFSGGLTVGSDIGTGLFVRSGFNGQTGPVDAIKIQGPNFPNDSTSAQDLRWSFASAGSAAIRSYKGQIWDTYLQFITTPLNSNTPTVRMHISENGYVGIGLDPGTEPIVKFHVANRTPNVQAGYFQNIGMPTNQSFGLAVRAGTSAGDYAFSASDQFGFSMFTIQGDGNVSIGGSQTGNKLNVNGIIGVATLGAAGSTTLCRNSLSQISNCSSSLRYKTNIGQFSQGMSFVQQLRPITFDWKSGGLRDVGFGAEDIAKIDPRFVTYNSAGEVEGVKYDRLSVTFVNAFKEQQAQIEAQKAEIEMLRAAICEMKPILLVCKK